MKRILFTAVGSTDPIAGQHDGAILHIARNYNIDEIYLYYSKEMCELEDKDNRYLYCLGKLQELQGRKILVHQIKRPDLVDVHVFDFFLREFKILIDEILNKEKCEMYLNVSSGTPAMKSALQLLGTISENKIITVQVATPSKSYNEKREDVKGDYEVELQWELNIDNNEGAISRCSVSTDVNYSVEIKKAIIKKQLKSYEYVAARDIALTMGAFIAPEAVELLKAATARIKLDKKQSEVYLKNIAFDMYPHKSGDECRIFEALMLGGIKIEKEEYIDFLRGISPLFFALLERIIEKRLSVNLSNYYYIQTGLNGTMFKQWDEYKVKDDLTLTNILTKNGRKPLTRSVVFSAHLVEYIVQKSSDSALVSCVLEVRDIEEKLRNPIAHCITYLNDDVIKGATGTNAKGIFNKLKLLATYAGIKITVDDMETYDKLNAEILKYL